MEFNRGTKRTKTADSEHTLPDIYEHNDPFAGPFSAKAVREALMTSVLKQDRKVSIQASASIARRLNRLRQVARGQRGTWNEWNDAAREVANAIQTIVCRLPAWLPYQRAELAMYEENIWNLPEITDALPEVRARMSALEGVIKAAKRARAHGIPVAPSPDLVLSPDARTDTHVMMWMERILKDNVPDSKETDVHRFIFDFYPKITGGDPLSLDAIKKQMQRIKRRKGHASS